MKKVEEMLVITMEECGELTQACSKYIRSSGRAKYRQNLREEVGDVMCMIEVLKMAGLVTDKQIQSRVEEKKKKLEKWSNVFNEREV